MFNIGIIGCGAIGKDHCRRIIETVPGATVVAVSDYVAAAADETAAKYGIKSYGNDCDGMIKDPEVEAVLAQADETAERIATLGGTPDGRADAIVRNRTWKSFDAEGRVGTEEYLKALIEYYDAFIADDRKAIAELDELDVISSNIIQDHVQELEKFQWFMRSHLA